MCAAAAPARGGDEAREGQRAVGGEDGLRRLDHQLDAQRSGLELAGLLDPLARLDRRRDLLGRRDLGKRDGEVRGQPTGGEADERPHEQVEGAERAAAQLIAQRLDADPDEGRERALAHAARYLLGAGLGVSVLLGVGAVAVAVLEVDSVVLDRLALQLLDDARVHGAREGLRSLQSDRARERSGIGRVLIERAHRRGPELCRDVGGEQVRAAVDGMDRLAVGAVSGVGFGEPSVRSAQPVQQLSRVSGIENGIHGLLPGSCARM